MVYNCILLQPNGNNKDILFNFYYSLIIKSMNAQTLLLTLLVLHLTGLVIMAGTTFVDFTIFKTFWKQFDADQEKSQGILQATSKSSRWIGIGAALLVLTGVGMMAITHGAFGEQTWFRIKFALVIILILNGILVGRRLGTRLRKTMTDGGGNISLQISSIRTNLNLFFFAQLFLLLMVVFLSVFKFN
jgi:uncharacterized membrane protein SirB2